MVVTDAGLSVGLFEESRENHCHSEALVQAMIAWRIIGKFSPDVLNQMTG